MYAKSDGTAQGPAVQRAMADNEPTSIYGKSTGTAQDAAVQRTAVDHEPPRMYVKSSRTFQGAVVLRTAAEDDEAKGAAAIFLTAKADESADCASRHVGRPPPQRLCFYFFWGLEFVKCILKHSDIGLVQI